MSGARTAGGGRTRWWVALLGGVVISAAVVVIAGWPARQAPVGFVLPEPVPWSPPTALRTVPGPPIGAPSVDVLVGALGEHGVVVGTIEDHQVGAWFVASDTDGEWREIDPPPVDVDVHPQLVSVGHDAVLVGEPCPDGLEPYDGGSVDCPGGTTGLGVWRLDHETFEWSHATLLDVDAPASPSWWPAQVLGVVDTVVYLDVSGTVVGVDVEGRRVPVEPAETGPQLSSLQVRCVTGSGTLVAEIRQQGAGTSDRTIVNPGLSTLAVREPLDTAWRVLDDVTLTHLQAVACGEDTIAVVGETDASLEEGEWRRLDVDGALVTAHRLPDEALLADLHASLATLFVGELTAIAGAGTDGVAIVRDLGDAVDIDDLQSDAPLTRSRQVVIVPGPGLPALVQGYPDAGRVHVAGATRQPGGQVVVLVRRELPGTEDPWILELLVAE